MRNALTLHQTGSQISHSTRLQPKRTVIVIIVIVIFCQQVKKTHVEFPRALFRCPYYFKKSEQSKLLGKMVGKYTFKYSNSLLLLS